jgi:hypothetical protein
MLTIGIWRGWLVGGREGSSHSTTRSWIRLKMNSSTTRSVPSVRETRSRDVEGGFEKMKWVV